MQTGNKFLWVVAGIISVGMLTSSCNKADKIFLKNEGTIYMPQAAGTRGTLALRLADTAQTVIFGAAYGGLQYSEQDINVAFKIDTSLVAAYNASHGTAYQVLPASSYTISGLTDIIKAGKTSSDGLGFAIMTNAIVFGTHYMLPVSIESVSPGKVDSALRTTYFAIDTITRLSVDITAQGTLSVSNENGGGSGAGEGSPKVVDGDLNTKYLNNYVNTMWIQLQFATPVAVGAYTLTSGGDASGRDPKTWDISGSNDGTTWTVVDSRTDYFFASRTQTVRFETSTPGAYKYYRMNITANNGSSLFQMSELRLIQYK
ncbi:hypothetical protein BH11BAC3_BH11BAC3_28050 [soil metagenome]